MPRLPQWDGTAPLRLLYLMSKARGEVAFQESGYLETQFDGRYPLGIKDAGIEFAPGSAEEHLVQNPREWLWN
jgi:hypothetical protein